MQILEHGQEQEQTLLFFSLHSGTRLGIPSGTFYPSRT